MIGADFEALRALASQFDHSAERLRSLAGSVSNGVRVSAWVGPVALRFRATWDSDHSVKLKVTAEVLEANATILRRNAADQERASDASTGTSRATGSSSLSTTETFEPPGGTSDDFGVFGSMSPDEHGVRIQKITAPDGTERYVVYINGTGSDGNMMDAGHAHSGYDAVSSAGGLNTETRRYIEQRMAAVPEGAEVKIVGYSQGGVHAMDIAASGDFNVTDVVTFGAPRSASVAPQLNGANVLHLEDRDDLIPVGGVLRSAEVFSPKNAYDNFRSLFSRDDMGSSATFQGSASTDGSALDVHGNPDTYREVGRMFDNSSDPRYEDIKSSNARYVRGRAEIVPPG